MSLTYTDTGLNRKCPICSEELFREILEIAEDFSTITVEYYCLFHTEIRFFGKYGLLGIEPSKQMTAFHRKIRGMSK